MNESGKSLEELVAYVERALLPFGKVTTNRRLYDADGHQIAEFDVEVIGQLGSTSIHWLIECRDRPSEGSAPASWIEQLIGRRTRFGYNKVTAVSTTGFSSGAITCASEYGIELRTVNSLSSGEFYSMLPRIYVEHTSRNAVLSDIALCFEEDIEDEKKDAISSLLSTCSSTPPLYVSSEVQTTDEVAFLQVVRETGLFDGMNNGSEKSVALNVHYLPGDRYSISTSVGLVEVPRIEFKGVLSVKTTQTPLQDSHEYSTLDGRTISERATFGSAEVDNKQVYVEVHRIAGSESLQLQIKKT